MLHPVKILSLQLIHNLMRCISIQQTRGQHRLFSLNTVWKFSIVGRIRHNHSLKNQNADNLRLNHMLGSKIFMLIVNQLSTQPIRFRAPPHILFHVKQTKKAQPFNSN
jgi:hypothetical protein